MVQFKGRTTIEDFSAGELLQLQLLEREWSHGHWSVPGGFITIVQLVNGGALGLLTWLLMEHWELGMGDGSTIIDISAARLPPVTHHQPQCNAKEINQQINHRSNHRSTTMQCQLNKPTDQPVSEKGLEDLIPILAPSNDQMEENEIFRSTGNEEKMIETNLRIW